MNFDVAYAYFESISKFDTSTLPFIIILFILLCIFINALFIAIQSMNYLDVTKIPDKQFIYMVVISYLDSLE